MEKIDVVTTATIRPKLLERTFVSFTEKLLCSKKRFHLIINIDPIGDSRYTAEDVLLVARNFFPDVTYNIAEEPNLSKSVIWCWKNIVSDYVFHLEDDWQLNRDLGGIDVLLNILKEYPKLASVGLNQLEKERMVQELVPGEWQSKEALRRKFAYIIRISLNPVLIRSEFLKAAVPFMKKNLKPESQIRVPTDPTIKRLKQKWKFGTYVGSGFEPVMEDTGRSWIIGSNWKKTRKGHFLYWKRIRVEEDIPIRSLCFDYRVDILFRAYVLATNDLKAWELFRDIPGNKLLKVSFDSLFEFRDSIREIGQQDVVNVVRYKGKTWPTMGAKRIASLISIGVKNIKVKEVPREEATKWNMSRNLSTDHIGKLPKEIKKKFVAWLGVNKFNV